MIKQTVEKHTKIVTTNFTPNQLIQFNDDIFESIELNLSFIVNLMKNAQLHATFNTFIGYDFFVCGSITFLQNQTFSAEETGLKVLRCRTIILNFF